MYVYACQTARLTAEVGPVREAGDDALIAGHDVHDTLLDKVHLVAASCVRRVFDGRGS